MKKFKILFCLIVSCLAFYNKTNISFAEELKFSKEEIKKVVLPIEPRGLNTHHYTIPIQLKTKNASEKFIIYKILEEKFFNEVFSLFSKKFRTYSNSVPLISGYLENLKRAKMLPTKEIDNFFTDSFCFDGVDVFIEDRESLYAIKKFLNNDRIKDVFKKFKDSLKKEDVENIYSRILEELKKSNKEDKGFNKTKNKKDLEFIKNKLKNHVALEQSYNNIKEPLDEKISKIIKDKQNNGQFLEELCKLNSEFIEKEIRFSKENFKKSIKIWEKLDLDRILKIAKSAAYKSSPILREIYLPDHLSSYYEDAILTLNIIKSLKYDKNKIQEIVNFYKEKLEKIEKKILEDKTKKANEITDIYLNQIYKEKNILTKNIKKEDLKKMGKDLFLKDLIYESDKILKSRKLYYENIIKNLEESLK